MGAITDSQPERMREIVPSKSNKTARARVAVTRGSTISKVDVCEGSIGEMVVYQFGRHVAVPLLFLILLFLVSSAPLVAAETWIKLDSPNAEIYTDAGENKGRRMLDRLEFLRYAFEQMGVSPPQSSEPLRVFYFESPRLFRRFTSGTNNTGSFLGDLRQSYIILYEHDGDRRVLSHEFGHYLLRDVQQNAPAWLEEGFAEYCSTVDVGDDGIEFGHAPSFRLETLRRRRWLEPNAFLRLTSDNLHQNEDKSDVFYAQSWAFVHMLTMSSDYRDGMPKFLDALRSGASQHTAFRRAFQKTPEQGLADLRDYILGDRRPILVVKSPFEGSRKWPARKLSASELQRALADLADHAARAAS